MGKYVNPIWAKGRDMIFENLINVRKKINPNAAAFAKEAGIPYTTFIKYERGERKPSFELLEYLVNAYNVSLNYIFSGAGSMFLKTDSNSGERQNDTSVDEKSSQFGKRLSQLQEKHNFLDREMATLLKISEKEYLKLVVGKLEPNLQILNRIKQNFKISIDYLLYGE